MNRVLPVTMLIVGLMSGFLMANNFNDKALAETTESAIVDQPTLTKLYDAAFGRPLDSGAGFHIGRRLDIVLRDINQSPERMYYSALFKSVKAYEEAIRAPGELSAGDKEIYLKAINSALSTLIAWVETLPERPICEGVVRPEEVKEAIASAYEGLSGSVKPSAQIGAFGTGVSVGAPSNLQLPEFRCKVPKPPIPTFTPPAPCPLAMPIDGTEYPCPPKPTPTPSCSPRPPCLDSTTSRCMMDEPLGGWCPKPTPVPTCLIRPACLDATPSCMMPEPIGGWCPNPPILN